MEISLCFRQGLKRYSLYPMKKQGHNACIVPPMIDKLVAVIAARYLQQLHVRVIAQPYLPGAAHE
jgi:hypothetical protein